MRPHLSAALWRTHSPPRMASTRFNAQPWLLLLLLDFNTNMFAHN
jgi:hypothetical protein